MRRLAIFWLLAGLLVCCGCSSLVSSWNSFNPLAEEITIASEQMPVVEIACMWQPAEGRSPKGTPSKGFSGQIYFFSKSSPEPVLVQGDVRIYLFADVGSYEQRTQPLHQYDFHAEAWKAHATRTSLGPGYGVFVPYPKPAHYQVRCHLRVRYQPPYGGPPVWSEGLEVVLDGPPRPEQMPVRWGVTEEASGVPTNEITISHRRVSADKLEDEGSRGTDGDIDATPLDMQSFEIGSVVPADYNTFAAGGEAAASGKRSRKTSGQHPVERMSEDEKLALIRRLMGKKGVERFKQQKTPDQLKVSSRPTPNLRRQVSDSILKGQHSEAKSHHPLADPVSHPLADSAERAPRLSESHPLAGGNSGGDAGIEPLDWDNRFPKSGAARSDQEIDPPNKIFGERWRDAVRERSGQTSDVANWPSPRRFVSPRPNRAVLLSEGQAFPEAP